METSKDVKILFIALNLRMWKKKGDDPVIYKPFLSIKDIFQYINRLKRTDRFMDLKGDKFCFIAEKVDIREFETYSVITGMFKSARNEFRPNIINKATGTERKNPKEKSEGDIEKTHFKD